MSTISRHSVSEDLLLVYTELSYRYVSFCKDLLVDFINVQRLLQLEGIQLLLEQQKSCKSWPLPHDQMPARAA